MFKHVGLHNASSAGANITTESKSIRKHTSVSAATQADPLDVAKATGEAMYSRSFSSDGDLPISKTRLSKKQREKLTNRSVAMPVESPRSLYLEASINGTDAMCLVDTGCSRCLISEDLYNRLLYKPKLNHTRFKFLMAQSSMDSKGVCHLEVSFAGKRFSQFFFVVPMANFDCILGLDFLSANDIGLMPSGMYMFFPEGDQVQLQRAKQFQSMSVRLGKTTHLEPEESKCVIAYGSSSLNNVDTPNNSYFCTMAQELWSHYGCVIYEGVAQKGKSDSFELWIYNPSSNQVTVHGNTVLAYMDSYRATTDLPEMDPTNKENLSDTDRQILMAMEEVCQSHLVDEQRFEEELDILSPPESSETNPPNQVDNEMITTMLSNCRSLLSNEQYNMAERLLTNYSDIPNCFDPK